VYLFKKREKTSIEKIRRRRKKRELELNVGARV
jgi:hypothetical protein